MYVYIILFFFGKSFEHDLLSCWWIIVAYVIQPHKLSWSLALSEFVYLRVFPGWLIFCIRIICLRSKMHLCVKVLQELKSRNQYQLSCNLQPRRPIWKTFLKEWQWSHKLCQKPSMIGLPWCFYCCWQVALGRCFGANDTFPPHAITVAMYGCSGKHTRSWLQTLPDGQKLGNCTVTGPTFFCGWILGLQKTQKKSMSNGVSLRG